MPGPNETLTVFYDGPLGGQRRYMPDDVLRDGYAELTIVPEDGDGKPEAHLYKVELRPVLVWAGPNPMSLEVP